MNINKENCVYEAVCLIEDMSHNFTISLKRVWTVVHYLREISGTELLLEQIQKWYGKKDVRFDAELFWLKEML